MCEVSSGLVVMRQVLSNYTYIWDRCVCMDVCIVCIYAGDVYTYVQCRAVKLIFLPSKKRRPLKTIQKKNTLQPSPKTELMPPNCRTVQLDIGHCGKVSKLLAEPDRTRFGLPRGFIKKGHSVVVLCCAVSIPFIYELYIPTQISTSIYSIDNDYVPYL